MRFAIAAGLLTISALSAPPATSATYVGSLSFNDTTADLKLVTNGAVGPLQQADFVDWSITLTNAGGTRSLRGPGSGNNSDLSYFLGSGLTSTATQIVFDLESNGLVQWDNFSRAGLSQATAFCIDGRLAVGTTCTGQSPSLNVLVHNVLTTTTGRSGAVVLASLASGVPEPATWSLMIAGIGFVGSALRQRRRRAQISFARA